MNNTILGYYMEEELIIFVQKTKHICDKLQDTFVQLAKYICYK